MAVCPYFSPAIDWCPVQVVPQFALKVSWEWLQLLRNLQWINKNDWLLKNGIEKRLIDCLTLLSLLNNNVNLSDREFCPFFVPLIVAIDVFDLISTQKQKVWAWNDVIFNLCAFTLQSEEKKNMEASRFAFWYKLAR